MFFQAVFESSFSFTYALFGAVVALYPVNDVFGVTVNMISDRSGFACSVECVRRFVRQICIYKVRQFFPHGYEPQGEGWVVGDNQGNTFWFVQYGSVMGCKCFCPSDIVN